MQRKLDHIKFAMKSKEPVASSGLEDVRLLNNSIPGLALEDIDTSLIFLGKKLKAPLLINAMTGGHPQTREINKCLATVAAEFGIAMAVGSQTAGIEDPTVCDSYAVVREVNPDGVILANLSAGVSPELAESAVKMIAADGLQLYLNVPQELVMPEGEREFKGVAGNIQEVVSSLEAPVLVKEVGFGLSREVVASIYRSGVRYIDVGGRGGTNFIAIENMRSGKRSSKDILDWGIPTAISLMEALSLNLPVFFVASGGLRSGVDVAKVLALGAGLAGMAGVILRALINGSRDDLSALVTRIIDELRLAMLMCGAATMSDLRQKPVLVTGFAAEWLERRGIEVNSYARR